MNGPEFLPDTSGIHFDDQYMDDYNRKIRSYVYRYAADGRNMHAEISDLIQPLPGQTVLDVGCASGELLTMVADANAGAELIGVDIKPGTMKDPSGNRDPRIKFMAADATRLPFADNSMDYVSALFVLYHVKDKNIPAALEEISRVVKPDGTILIATSGKRNKEKNRMFDAKIAEYRGLPVPPHFNEPFTTQKAKVLLPEYFDIVVDHGVEPQSTEMIITPDRVNDYIHSLATMGPSYEHYPKGYFKSITEKVLPVIYSEIEDKGYFTDRIERTCFVCRPKTS